MFLDTALAVLLSASAPYTLSFRGPAGCPEESTVQADVASRVRDPAKAEGAVVSLSIAKEGAELVGALSLVDGSGRPGGTRQIRGNDCFEVAQALAFFAALAIDLGGHLDADEAPAPAGPWLATSVGLSGGVRSGLATGVQPEVDVGVEFSRAGPELLSPAAALNARVASGRVAGAARFWLFTSALTLSPVKLGNETVFARPRLGLELGVLRAVSEVVDGPRDSNTFWAAATAGLSFRWHPWKWFFVEVAADVVVPLTRTHFYVGDQSQLLWVVPNVAGRGGVGVGIAL